MPSPASASPSSITDTSTATQLDTTAMPATGAAVESTM